MITTMKIRNFFLVSCLAAIYLYASNEDYKDLVRQNELYCEMIMSGEFNWRQIDCNT